MRVLVHAPGPPHHGVVRHAAQIARLARPHGVQSFAAGVVEGAAQLSHAQFTDALYGPDIGAAAAAFAAWAATAPRPLVVTLHDVPGADLDPARDSRRGVGYAHVAAVSDAVVVASAHEAAKVTRLTGRRAETIPLPVETLPHGGTWPVWADRPTLGVLGFIYPGKGHATAVEAAARRLDPPRVVAVGAAGSGHVDLQTALAAQAATRGVDLLVTGPLCDVDLAAAARAVTVPLAPNPAVSASGSVATWLGCGRGPVAARGDYTSELARRHPGTLHLYDDDAGLDRALERALTDPTHTRLVGPDTWPDVGAAHAALYARLLSSAGRQRWTSRWR